MRVVFLFFIYCFNFFCTFYVTAVEEDRSVWLLQEEFIKFGKKDAYESLQSQWLNGFQKSLNKTGLWRTKKKSWPIYGFQALDEPQYLYFVPLQNICGLQDYFLKIDEYRSSMSKDELLSRQSLSSLINFSMNSLHVFLKRCSCLQNDEQASWQANPYIHFWVLGIANGNETVFEDHLASLSKEFKEKSSSFNWKVWKVLVGSDMPKYIIIANASSLDSLKQLKKSVPFLSQNMKDILRNQKEGDGILKTSLSIRP